MHLILTCSILYHCRTLMKLLFQIHRAHYKFQYCISAVWAIRKLDTIEKLGHLYCSLNMLEFFILYTISFLICGAQDWNQYSHMLISSHDLLKCIILLPMISSNQLSHPHYYLTKFWLLRHKSYLIPSTQIKWCFLLS